MNDFPKFKIILGTVAFWFFCIIGSTAFSQDRVLEYKPNAFEKKIIDAVSAEKSSTAGKLRYDDRISRAIGLAIDTLPMLNDSIIDLIFRPLGGFHRLIALDSAAYHDGNKAELTFMNTLPDSGNYAIKEIYFGGRNLLLIYFSDVYRINDPGGGQGGGFSPFPYMPNYYFCEYTATINADSLRYVLYKGDFSLFPARDSVVKDTVIPVIMGKVKVKFEFEKMQFDIQTANIYAFSHNRRCYDLIGMYLPVNHPIERPRKK